MKKLLCLLAVAAAAFTTVAPAQAYDFRNPLPLITTDPVLADESLAFVSTIEPRVVTAGGGRSFVVSGVAKGFRSASGTFLVSMTCEIQAIGDAASTRVTECRLYLPGGVLASSNYPSANPTPGPSAATTSRFTVPARTGYYMCADGVSTWLLAPTAASGAPRACTQLI